MASEILVSGSSAEIAGRLADLMPSDSTFDEEKVKKSGNVALTFSYGESTKPKYWGGTNDPSES